MSGAPKRQAAFIAVSAVCGALLFCLLSVINKIQMGASLTLLKGYLAPFVVGFISGGLLGQAFFRISALNRKLQGRLEELGKFLVICSHCSRVKTLPNRPLLDPGAWTPLPQFLEEKTKVTVSHGLCPTCVRSHFPEEYEKIHKAGRAGARSA